MSGVLSAKGEVFVERGETITAVCDALVAHVPGEKPRLVFPLDGRHGLAGHVLDEAQKRGWEFGRHPPVGQEMLVLDLDGPDAEAAMSAEQVTPLLEKLAGAMGDAWNDNELGESMGIGRQALTLCLHHFGGWHPYTYWIMSNLFQASARTGNDDNIREACAFVTHLLASPAPSAIIGAQSSIVRLDELAHRCIGVREVALATRVYDAALVIARTAHGEDSSVYRQVQQRKAASLPA